MGPSVLWGGGAKVQIRDYVNCRAISLSAPLIVPVNSSASRGVPDRREIRREKGQQRPKLSPMGAKRLFYIAWQTIPFLPPLTVLPSSVRRRLIRAPIASHTCARRRRRTKGRKMTQKGRYTVFGQKMLAGQRSHIPRTIEGFPEKREGKIGGKVAERKKRKLWEDFFPAWEKNKGG